MRPSLLLLFPPARRLLALLPLLLTGTAVHAQGQGQGHRPAMNPSMQMPSPRGLGNGNGNGMGMGNGIGMGNGMGLQRDPPGLLKQQNWMQPGNSGNVGNAANAGKAANAANPGEAGEVADLQQSRARTVKNLIRRYRDVIEADPRGEPVLRRQLLAWSPSQAVLEAVRADGFTVLGQRVLGGLGETLVVLGVPERYSTEEALARLQALDPDGSHDFNHLYISSGEAGKPSSPVPGRRGAASGRPAVAGPVRVGLVDGGIDGTHQAFQHAAIQRWGCAGRVVPSAHGTAVASLLIGSADRFHGVSPGARLYAADAYCGSEMGGAVDQIVEALAWLARKQVAVVNVSLVGPPNHMLERAVLAMLKRGHLLIAAVGNDGPAAPPLYPASYPGVIGVSGADAQQRILPEAARGPQVMFAAPGSQMLAASVGPQPYGVVRGTSFAAPIVAAMLAQSMRKPDLAAGRAAVAKLAAHAQRLGSGERSADAGYGLVGEAFRIAPEARP